MAELCVRKLSDEVIVLLKERAKSEGCGTAFVMYQLIGD